MVIFFPPQTYLSLSLSLIDSKEYTGTWASKSLHEAQRASWSIFFSLNRIPAVLFLRTNFCISSLDQIRTLQRSQTRYVPRFRHTDDIDRLTNALRRNGIETASFAAAAAAGKHPDCSDDPTACTHSTHRCHHAAHAYSSGLGTTDICAQHQPSSNSK